MPLPDEAAVNTFIERWKDSGGHERGAAQLFLTELCDLLDLPHADPPSENNLKNSYCFERVVPHTRHDGKQTSRFIDCYKRGCFVLETKQGINADETPEDLRQIKLLIEDKAKVSKSKGHGTRGTSTWDVAMEKAKNRPKVTYAISPTKKADLPS